MYIYICIFFCSTFRDALLHIKNRARGALGPKKCARGATPGRLRGEQKTRSRGEKCALGATFWRSRGKDIRARGVFGAKKWAREAFSGSKTARARGVLGAKACARRGA